MCPLKGQGNGNSSKMRQRLASCLLGWPNSEIKETRHSLEGQDPLFFLFLNQTLTLEFQVIVIKASRTCSYVDITTKHLPAFDITTKHLPHGLSLGLSPEITGE